MRVLSKTPLLLIALAVAPAAVAERAERHPPTAVEVEGVDFRYHVAQQDGPTLSEAVEMVRRQCNCRIVSAETRVSGNREVHIIKALTEDGKVKTFHIPGRSRGG